MKDAAAMPPVSVPGGSATGPLTKAGAFLLASNSLILLVPHEGKAFAMLNDLDSRGLVERSDPSMGAKDAFGQ